ncbi:MAG: hypothetical protein WC764_00840 [Candidatus Paceibacterota bacterium]
MITPFLILILILGVTQCGRTPASPASITTQAPAVPVQIWAGHEVWKATRTFIPTTPRFVWGKDGKSFRGWEKSRDSEYIARYWSTRMTRDTTTHRAFEYVSEGNCVTTGVIDFHKSCGKSRETTPEFITARVVARVDAAYTYEPENAEEGGCKITLNFRNVELWRPEDIPPRVLDQMP